VVGTILKQHNRTARLAWARARRRWRFHIWQHVLFSDESRFSLRFSDERYRVYRKRGERFTDQCVHESDRTDVILAQKVLTNTSHVTSCIVML
jgi:hypothetical protein